MAQFLFWTATVLIAPPAALDQRCSPGCGSNLTANCGHHFHHRMSMIVSYTYLFYYYNHSNSLTAWSSCILWLWWMCKPKFILYCRLQPHVAQLQRDNASRPIIRHTVNSSRRRALSHAQYHSTFLLAADIISLSIKQPQDVLADFI